MNTTDLQQFIYSRKTNMPFSGNPTDMINDALELLLNMLQSVESLPGEPTFDEVVDYYDDNVTPVDVEEVQLHSALDVQIGGNHYKDKKIQPVQYIHANNLGFCEGNVVKYVSRRKEKNGIADLEKAKHYIELLIELEKGQN